MANLKLNCLVSGGEVKQAIKFRKQALIEDLEKLVEMMRQDNCWLDSWDATLESYHENDDSINNPYSYRDRKRMKLIFDLRVSQFYDR